MMVKMVVSCISHGDLVGLREDLSCGATGIVFSFQFLTWKIVHILCGNMLLAFLFYSYNIAFFFFSAWVFALHHFKSVIRSPCDKRIGLLDGLGQWLKLIMTWERMVFNSSHGLKDCFCIFCFSGRKFVKVLVSVIFL